jgi:hypothetical protein
LSAGSEDLHGSLLSFSAPRFVRCAAKLACLAVLRCTLLEVLDLLAQPPKLKKSPGKVVRRHGVVLAPEHWTRAASLKRPFENRRQMPLPNKAAKRSMIA